MKKNLNKDKKLRSTFLQNELARRVLKSITKNGYLPVTVRKKAKIELSSFPKNSSIVRLRNRCTLTGRARSLVGGFNLSRLMLRKLGRDGMIHGLKKSS